MVKQLTLGSNLYANDYKNHVMPFSGDTPSAPGSFGYWMHALLAPYLDQDRGNFAATAVQKE